jgi:5-aminopentanamidase
VRLALLQFAPRPGVLEPNLRYLLDGAAEAAAGGADLLIAPEMCLTGWVLRDPGIGERLAAETKEVAIPELVDASRETGIGLVVGGPLPALPAGATNSAIAIAPDGGRAIHRKLHLFGEEAAWWVQGDAVNVLTVAGTTVGPLICYDAEFPEVPRLLRLAGANLMAVAATNMSPYERDQDLIFPTRALENECIVAVCNRVGSENDWTYFGRSLVADSRGGIVAQAGSGEELLFAEADAADTPPDPALGYLAHRRPHLYAELAVSPRRRHDRPAGIVRSAT